MNPRQDSQCLVWPRACVRVALLLGSPRPPAPLLSRTASIPQLCAWLSALRSGPACCSRLQKYFGDTLRLYLLSNPLKCEPSSIINVPFCVHETTRSVRIRARRASSASPAPRTGSWWEGAVGPPSLPPPGVPRRERAPGPHCHLCTCGPFSGAWLTARCPHLPRVRHT